MYDDMSRLAVFIRPVDVVMISDAVEQVATSAANVSAKALG
jgi:hypothetical protein